MNSHSTWTLYLGWTATAVFVASYVFKQPSSLRIAQMAGAVLWIIYGLAIGAIPVVVANALVFSAAAVTALRKPRAEATRAV